MDVAKEEQNKKSLTSNNGVVAAGVNDVEVAAKHSCASVRERAYVRACLRERERERDRVASHKKHY